MHKVYCEMVSKFRNRNNSTKPFQLYWLVFTLLLAIFGLAIQKSAQTATSRQQKFEMVRLSMEYHRDTSKWFNTYIASFYVINENESALITCSKLNPFFYDDK